MRRLKEMAQFVHDDFLDSRERIEDESHVEADDALLRHHASPS